MSEKEGRGRTRGRGRGQRARARRGPLPDEHSHPGRTRGVQQGGAQEPPRIPGRGERREPERRLDPAPQTRDITREPTRAERPPKIAQVPSGATPEGATALDPEQFSRLQIRSPFVPRRNDDDSRTRPPSLQDKTGKTGTALNLITNHCVVESYPGHKIYQYSVTYKPQIESKSMRIGLLAAQTEALNLRVRVFDGMILYLPHGLEKDITEVDTKTRDGTVVQIIIKLTNVVSAQSPTCLQLLNVLFRRYESTHCTI